MVLLAKPDETLRDHTVRALGIAENLVDIGCHERIFGQGLYDVLTSAVVTHDLGKAAAGFQKTLKGGGHWGYRHEILSAAILSLLKWPSEDFGREVALTVLSHHKDLDTLWNGYSTLPRGAGGYERYLRYLGELHSTWNELVGLIPELADKCSRVSRTAADALRTIPRDWESALAEMSEPDPFVRYVGDYRQRRPQITGPERTRLMGLRGLMLTCDHLASAHASSLPRVSWTEVFSGFNPRPIQRLAAGLTGPGIIVAPTGVGKTEAALLWSANNGAAKRRVLYLLPTTASINKMYERLRDMLSQGDTNRFDVVSMLHHRSAQFLYSYYAEEDYQRAGVDPAYLASVARKIYSAVKVTTPYQPLKTLFGVRGFEMGLAEVTGALIVVDEVHTYDPHTIALILFLLEVAREQGSDILLMSATFPSFLRREFARHLRIPADKVLIDSSLDERVRHRVRLMNGDVMQHVDDITERVHENRVLIVCNTVNRALQVYDDLVERLHSADVTLLHGRFALRDRIEREGEIESSGVLVATQAVEVSLDLDFDVLFTEPAPVDALLQRFGRVNRQGRIRPAADVFVFSEGGPYDDRVYTATERVSATLRELRERDAGDGLLLSEAGSRAIVEAVYREGYTEEEQSRFEGAYDALRSTWETVVPMAKPRRDEYMRLFDSVEIIPSYYEEEAQEVSGQRWFDLPQYILSVRRYVFGTIVSENLVRYTLRGMPVCDVPYDPRRGLLVKELMRDEYRPSDEFIL